MRELRIDERRKGRNTEQDRDESEDTHVESSWIGVVAQGRIEY